MGEPHDEFIEERLDQLDEAFEWVREEIREDLNHKYDRLTNHTIPEDMVDRAFYQQVQVIMGRNSKFIDRWLPMFYTPLEERWQRHIRETNEKAQARRRAKTRRKNGLKP